MTKLLFILIIVALTLVSLTLPSKNISPFTFYFLKKFTLILIIINTGVLQFLNTLYIQPIGSDCGIHMKFGHPLVIFLSLENFFYILNSPLLHISTFYIPDPVVLSAAWGSTSLCPTELERGK